MSIQYLIALSILFVILIQRYKKIEFSVMSQLLQFNLTLLQKIPNMEIQFLHPFRNFSAQQFHGLPDGSCGNKRKL